ncbi:MAG: ribulose-phosphate 3-epimerase, partial [Clostridia bacterium]|nr:ribulose-phosphate 3-epimerase [Clostridia bacterium]
SDIELEVDGGITIENVGYVKRAGANVIVAGSTVFNAPDMKEAIDALRTL